MDITEITANDVMLDLNPREHLALSRSFSMLMASLEPSDIRSTLGWSVEQAYELSYSVYVRRGSRSPQRQLVARSPGMQ